MPTEPMQKPVNISKPNYLESVVHGRILSSEFFNGRQYTTINTPSKDAYSKPSEFKIASSGQIGNVGQEVTIPVEISGFSKRPKQYKDSTTGEQKVFVEHVVYLNMVE